MSPEEAAWQVAGAPFPLAEVPKPTEVPDEITPSVHVITDAALRNAIAEAEHLEYLTGVIHDDGMRTWLTDAASSLRCLVQAVEELAGMVQKLREGRA
ncbi:hypothetical protein [Humibacter ginsenosidimutans]|uniref:Uncharacterized protein n=1 Tax=Humibacter ginsenosidimutans TaxID=2599293 RepID=A0A5B8M884_9MICO|nr:hypothetical protein [Humibacter ginsenosidimutans]QDZ15812.1 hypothetical protein FPZ11_14485 [Humibacter ginsenosidimutans]